MAPPSPARFFATAAGALLIVVGLVGFFFGLDWINFANVALGALGIWFAAAAPRPYALLAGLALIGLAVWGLVADQAWMPWLHLGLGLAGLAAFAGSSEARAQVAAERS